MFSHDPKFTVMLQTLYRDFSTPSWTMVFVSYLFVIDGFILSQSKSLKSISCDDTTTNPFFTTPVHLPNTRESCFERDVLKDTLKVILHNNSRSAT